MSADFDRIVSPVSVAHFSQYKLSGLLLNKLAGLGFRVKNSVGFKEPVHSMVAEKEILMGHECISIKSADHGVTVTALFDREGKRMEKDIHCNFLVGADGASSTVRLLVGINMKGERDLQKLVSVHFLSQDLGQYLVNERPGMLFFIFNTEAIGVLVAHDLKEGEFVLQVPYYPPQQKLEDFSSEDKTDVSVKRVAKFISQIGIAVERHRACELLNQMCERLISKLVGQELADVNVLDIKPWVMHAEVAEKFLSWNSRVILAGDAAHRFPPAGGFGMNTGIQDAHNLAWKLAFVSQSIAPLSFLSTYETERKQISCFNTALSVQNFKAALAVPAALGLDPNIANAVHRAINNTVGSVLPFGLQKTLLDGIFSIGRAQLSDFVLNEKNPLGSSRLGKLKQIFEGGKSLQLQFPAEDLGFRYRKGALVSDGDNKMDASEAPTGRRRDYVPSTDPGSRLPHMNVRPLSNLSSKEPVSTLDLISVDKVEFLLIIAPLEESYNLAQAAFMAAESIKVPLKVCVMWPENTTDGNGRSEASLQPWKNFVDVAEIRRSPISPSWWNLCQMTDRGAILMRPDEHVAWRSKSGKVNDPTSEMKLVFNTIFGLDTTCP